MPTGFAVGNQWREVADTPAAGNFAAMSALVSGAGIPWAGHATAVTAGAGALQWFVLGANSVLMRSDGINWRPMNGRALLYQRSRTITNPIATMTGTAAVQVFTLPDTLLIPAGLMIAESRVYITARMRRITAGGGGAFVTRMQFGTSNSSSDSAVNAISMAASATADADLYSYLGFRTTASQNRNSTGSLNSTSSFNPDTSIDSTVATYVNFGSDATMAATEQMILIAYSVAVEF